jgi:hypothetical protein
MPENQYNKFISMKKIPYSFSIILALFQCYYAGCEEWPVLKSYEQEHIYKIAPPLGGIGTGTVSLGGRGNLQDWEIMNRPAKGYNPGAGRENSAFFTLYTEIDGKKDLRLLEGPVPFYLYEGSSGAIATNTVCRDLRMFHLMQLILSDRLICGHSRYRLR